MSEEVRMIELPSYLSIDTEDGLKIEIDTEKFLNSIPTGVLEDALLYRHDYDPIDCADTHDLVEELRDRDYDFAKELGDEDIENEYFNRKLWDDNTVSDCIFQVAKILSPREVLDKDRVKQLINDWIDLNITYSYR